MDYYTQVYKRTDTVAKLNNMKACKIFFICLNLIISTKVPFLVVPMSVSVTVKLNVITPRAPITRVSEIKQQLLRKSPCSIILYLATSLILMRVDVASDVALNIA